MDTKNFFKISSLIFLALTFTACQKNQKTSGSGLIGEALMADRPVLKAKNQVYLIELAGEPLLATAQKNDRGVNQIDEEAKANLKKEQADLESKLQALSSEIKVLYRYQYIVNAIAVVAPVELEEKVKALSIVKAVSPRQAFLKPRAEIKMAEMKSALNLARTSVTHIEAQPAYDAGIKGQGMRVGVIDTGLDYTHKMLGGSGVAEDFKAIDPNTPSKDFPNKKVVGGIDLVGSKFDVASLDSDRKIPQPDLNPIDEEGHGSHVGGTIAGLGDGVNSYDGVAPEASLYAIKVFGSGSTSDEVVIAGLEWAVDPNQDGVLDDQLNVVNLSLGGANGNPYELYNKAVRQLSLSGTVVVASAGNESDVPFIVGSPSTSDEALSVAANIDGSDHNWKFKTVSFMNGTQPFALAEAIEGATSKPITEADDVRGELALGGLADRDYTEEESASLKGKVVLIDRGAVTFQEKLTRAAAAGAVGVIVAQNRNEPAFTMGGDKKVEIPAIMITQELGNKLKAQMEKSVLTVVFQSPDMIEKPELISKITDFSSRGPRSSDLLIKPEITGPGQNIISAAMGEGAGTVKLSGTSMSGPHLAGVMALLKQKFSKLSSRELKSVVMSTAVQIKTDGKPEPVSRQGAGEVRVSRALQARIVTEPAALSLGLQQIDKSKRLSRTVRIKSLFDDELKFQVSLESSSNAVALESTEVIVKPQGLSDLKLNLTLRASALAGVEEEVTGWIVLLSGDKFQKIPFLVRLQKVSDIKLTKVDLGAESRLEMEGSSVRLELTNRSAHQGEAWLFNLVGLDDRKPASDSVYVSRDCDIKAVGYRVSGDDLEVAVKFYNRVSTWGLCEVSVLLDKDQDKKPEAELALTVAERVPGMTGRQVMSTLLDFPKARELREAAEKKSKEKPSEKVTLDFKEAIINQVESQAEDMRSAVILKASLSDLKAVVGTEPRIQVVSNANESKNAQADDYLKDEKKWTKLSFNPQDQGWVGLQNVSLQGGETRNLEVEKGSGPEALMIVTPLNQLDTRGNTDDQIQIYKPRFEGEKAPKKASL